MRINKLVRHAGDYDIVLIDMLRKHYRAGWIAA